MDYSLFVFVPHIVLVDEQLSSTEKLILIEILAQMTANHPSCDVPNSHFAKVFNLQPESVSRAISNLAKRKWVSVKITEADGNRRIIKPIGVLERVTTYCEKYQDHYPQKHQDLINIHNKRNISTNSSNSSISLANSSKSNRDIISKVSLDTLSAPPDGVATEKQVLGDDKVIKKAELDRRKGFAIASRLLTLYKQRFNNIYHSVYYENKMDIVMIKRLYDRIGDEAKLEQALENYMADRSDFIKNLTHGLGFFTKYINRYLVMKPAVKPNGKSEAQLRQELADAADREKEKRNS